MAYNNDLFNIRSTSGTQEEAARRIADYANTNSLNTSQIAGAFGIDPSEVAGYASRYGLKLNADSPTMPTPNMNLPAPPAQGANVQAFTPQNYLTAAMDQGRQNQWAADTTNRMSNPNIYTPFGSQTVTYDADGRPTVTQQLSPEQQAQFDQLNQFLARAGDQIGHSLAKPLGEYEFSGVDALDLNALPGRTIDPTVGGMESVAQALRDREASRFSQARSKMEADLLARGFNPGTSGYNARLDDINRAENDFSLGATVAAGQEQERLFNMESGARTQALAEQLARYGTQDQTRGREISEAITARSLPIQEYSALRGAMTPSLSGFQQYTGANVNPAPIFDAFDSAGLFDLAKYATQVQGELGTRQIDAQKKQDNRGALFDIIGSLF